MYLALFVLAVLTPEIIRSGGGMLDEEDIEALLIFCFGAAGFMMYLVKEKALLSLLRERLHLQRQTHDITRDLSDSYSYIGEVNRKLDILKELVFQLPARITEVSASNIGKTPEESYQSVLEAVRTFSRAESATVVFVDMAAKASMKMVSTAGNSPFPVPESSKLAASKKLFYEEDGLVIVRSPELARGIAAFIIFQKAMNRVDDADILKMFAASALALYCVNR